MLLPKPFELQEFRCADGEKCIGEFQKCNHRKECTDGSDENNCSKLILPSSLGRVHQRFRARFLYERLFSSYVLVTYKKPARKTRAKTLVKSTPAPDFSPFFDVYLRLWHGMAASL